MHRQRGASCAWTLHELFFRTSENGLLLPLPQAPLLLNEPGPPGLRSLRRPPTSHPPRTPVPDNSLCCPGTPCPELSGRD